MKITYIFFSATLWLILAKSPALAQSSTPPNIILILADDLSPAYLGCYGGPTPTPHLDRLAAEGARFNQAFAGTALCNPSRYTLLTGQMPSRNANVIATSNNGGPCYVQQNTVWKPSDPSVAKALRPSGYYTGYVGKWHSNFEDFDMGEKLPENLDKDDPKTTVLLQDIQKRQVQFVKSISGFDYVSNLQFGNLDNKPGWMGHHNTEWITQGAVDFIKSAKKAKKPFYLHLANSMPHSPDIIKSIKQENKYTLGGKLESNLTCHPPRQTIIDRLKKAGMDTTGPIASINAGAIYLDDQLAAIRKTLEEQGLADNTLIIWVADHSIYGKGSCYLSGIKVPLLLHWQGKIPGKTLVDQQVSLVDLYKTSLAAAGQTKSSDLQDGENILPLATGLSQSHGSVYSEVNWFRSVVKGKYHYIAYRPSEQAIKKMASNQINFAVDQEDKNMRNIFGDLNLLFKPAYFDAEQLYNIEQDSLERHNLAYLPAYQELLKEMKMELQSHTSKYKVPYPLEVPAYMHSREYQEKINARKKLAAQKEHYPEKYDAEMIYNNNLKDPLTK